MVDAISQLKTILQNKKFLNIFQLGSDEDNYDIEIPILNSLFKCELLLLTL